MNPTSVHDIRNLALIGPPGTGKSTLAAALLAAAGERDVTPASAGLDVLEARWGHSLAMRVQHCAHEGRWLNLIDTPGLPDLAGRALPALTAVETAVVVVDAGHALTTSLARQLAFAHGRCRMIVVNRIDAAGAALADVLARIQAVAGTGVLPLNLPTADGQAVVDCFFAPDPGVATLFSSVTAAHDALVDRVVELDDALMERYLEQGQALAPEQLHDAFEAALREGHLIPLYFTSARTGAGIAGLLDVLARLAPDPTEGLPPVFMKGDGGQACPVVVEPDPGRHVLAHVFQVSHDPYRGKLALMRVFQGRIASGAQLFVGDARKPIRAAHLFRPQAGALVETAQGLPGELCALARVDELHPEAVLHDSHDEDHHHLALPAWPRPTYGLALIPQRQSDEQKLAEALLRLCEEDRCLRVAFDARHKRTVVRGLGALHVRLVLEELAERFGLNLQTATPSVPYQDTIAVAAEARYRHKKQSGGAGQFGEVALRVEPLARGSGIVFVDEVKGGVIPGQFMAAVERGVRAALLEGVRAGHAVHDVRVVVFDGKYHAVDSNEVSFMTAARQAVIQAVLAARPYLLEPLVSVQASVPEGNFGEVSAEFSGRRGRVVETGSEGDGQVRLVAWVPLAELDGFEIRLKAISQGNGQFVLGDTVYERAPAELEARVLAGG